MGFAGREGEDLAGAAILAAPAGDVEGPREDEAARRAGLPLAVRAGTWAASVAAYVVDPVTSWLQGWRGAPR